MTETQPQTAPEDVLDFWFGKDSQNPLSHSSLWWKKDPAFDQEIREKFGKALRNAAQGTLSDWGKTPQGRLALIILLDQFSRNMYRNQPESFANDALALSLSLEGIRQGMDQGVSPEKRVFFYMPLMHSENNQTQEQGLEVYRQLADSAPPELKKTLLDNLDFAGKHAAIIRRFGRFPHRNLILGRTSTPEEIEFLKGPDSSF